MDTRLPLSSPRRTLVGCVTTGSCDSTAPKPRLMPSDSLSLGSPSVKNTGETERLLSMATSLAAEGDSDQAIPLFWQAMRANSSHAGALKIASATLALGKDYKEVKLGALSAAVTTAQTRGEALATAELAWLGGNAWDRYALGALHKALKLSTTRDESLEIMTLAQGHGRLAGKNRYKDLQDAARTQALGQ